MKKKITFKIEGYEKSFMVQELTVKELINLIQGDTFKGTDLSDLKSVFFDELLPMCSNITQDDLMEFAPSELEVAWDKFREMNKSFFGMAQTLGLTDVLQELKQAAIKDFGNLLVVLPKQDTPES